MTMAKRTEEYLQKHLRGKKIHGSKEAKEIRKIRNTSTEKEILYGLQTNDHFFQPSILDTICKRDTERKQVIPVCRGNTQCKCINVTDKNKKKSICTMAKNKESLLAKIKFMTGEQRNILSNDFFNQEVEHLKKRVEQIECTRTHKDIVKTSLKKLSELEKDMKAVLLLQEEATPRVAVLEWDADADTQVGINACLETNG